MPAASLPEIQELRVALPLGSRLRLLAWNALPLAQLALAIVLASLPWAGWGVRALAVTGWIFVVPALLARALLALRPVPSGDVPFGSEGFFTWWAVSNLQGLFNRFPFLEEILRLVPGLYSAWLRLWGARVGGLTFWAPGTVVLDRPFLEIGEHVVIGTGVKLNSHLLARGSGGDLELQVAPITLGDGAIVGGYSVLGPGTEVAPHETTIACQVMPPFSRWEGGRRWLAKKNKGAGSGDG